MESNELIKSSDFLFYNGKDGKIHVQIIMGNETVWTTQKGMSEIFKVEIPTINYHLKEIFGSEELDEKSVIRKILTTATDGKNYNTNFYNLDVIISVGYRVNSYNATQFRKWATRVLKEYLAKGFALDDERLKQGNQLFGKDYFKELLERIKEIRASEKMFYEKIKDLYATSVDYDKQSPDTRNFFSRVQNMLEFAIVGKTSAEIIKSRADATMPNMGLKTFKNSGKEGGDVTKSDIYTAKNYLNEDEIRELNHLVNMYLDYAELQVTRNKIMKMQDWTDKLSVFLKFNEYKILEDFGKIRKDVADKFAEQEYSKYRIIQDNIESAEFVKVIDDITKSNKIPSESEFIEMEPKKEVSDFDSKLLQTFGENNPNAITPNKDIAKDNKPKQEFKLPKIPKKPDYKK